MEVTADRLEKGNIYLERPWLKFYPDGLSPDIQVPRISLTQAFDAAAKRWANKTALVFYGRRIRYAELKNLVDRFASALHDLGVGKGDRVGLLLLNSPQFAIAYFAALRVGAMVTSISPFYATPEIKYQLEDSRTETIVCQDILYDSVMKTGLKPRRIIVTGIGEYLPWFKNFLARSFLNAVYQKMEIPAIKIEQRGNIFRFQDLIEKGSPNPPIVTIDPEEDVAVIPYTAGTTGSPKGVMLTHFNLLAMQVLSSAFWSFSFGKGKSLEEGREVAAAFFPFSHVYGQAILLVGGLVRGQTLVILTAPEPDDIIKSVKKYGVTFLMGVPGSYGLLTDHEKADRVNWKQLKLAVSCADTLSEGTARRWESRTGVQIHESYGLAEAAPIVCINPNGRCKTGSFGIPLPNTMAAIVRTEGAEMVAPGEIGELVVKGPQVMKGYWDRHGETEQSFVEISGEQWLKTGDLARIDEEGYFHFYDRKRDLIECRGHTVFAREIEEVLRTHPKIKEAAVIAAPDPEAGTNIKAVIVLQADARGKLSEEEIVRYCHDHLDDFKIPRIIEFRREIPRTDVGKVSRRELREEREG